MANVPNAIEKYPKITTACTSVTDDTETTYIRQHIANVNVSL